MTQTLLLQHQFALGDTVLLTALVRDIALTYPGRFDMVVDCAFRDVFDHNPYAQALRTADQIRHAVRRLPIRYRDGIKAAGHGEKVHMLSWYHRNFSEQMHLPLQPTLPKGDLRLVGDENRPLLPGRYWVLVDGGKTDCTTKWWRPERYQQLADALHAAGIVVVQAGVMHKANYHTPLNHVLSMVGRTPTSRQFIQLIAHAEGVICPITAAMHIAACFDKPCVVIAGGREEPWWEGYTRQYPGAFGTSCPPVVTEHRFLHTLGQLSCCNIKGCWKHRVEALNDRQLWDAPDKRCHQPVTTEQGTAARCLDLITVDQVMAAVSSYAGHKSASPVVLAPALPVVMAPSAVSIVTPSTAPIAAPTLIDKFTVFVLCFGNYPQLARSCLESIYATLPQERMDLRVGLNAVCAETRQYVKSLPGVTRVYDSPVNLGKYVLMRKMFHDPDCPIVTPYLVWLDDDVRAVRPDWAQDLSTTIARHHAEGCRIYGAPFIHDLMIFRKNGHEPLPWFQQATWWRGRPLRIRGQAIEAPNGTIIPFCVGWAWALATATMHEADIPDRRLEFNGGDVTITEQVHQAGYKLKAWNQHKALLWCPTKENGGRRGKWTTFPWAGPVEAHLVGV